MLGVVTEDQTNERSAHLLGMEINFSLPCVIKPQAIQEHLFAIGYTTFFARYLSIGVDETLLRAVIPAWDVHSTAFTSPEAPEEHNI